MSVRWMREGRSKETHGIVDVELALGFETVTAIGHCGPFHVEDLIEDELAGRCAACVRAAMGAQQ